MFLFEKKNRKTFICFGACVLIASCAQDRPRLPGYDAALEACRSTAHVEADRRVKQVSYLFFIYPISFPLEQRAKTRECLQAKGYAL